MKRIVAAAFLLIFCSAAFAVNVNVNCNAPGLGGRIKTALKSLNPAGPNTVTVSGTCKENVVIQGFDRLTLRAANGATITDASDNQDWAVIFINDSRRVSIEGFTIIGGKVGIECNDASLCRTSNNVIQGTLWNGIDVNTSQLTSWNDTIQPAGGLGFSTNGSTANASFLTVTGGRLGANISSSTVTGVNWKISGASEDGIDVNSNSHFQLIDSEITNNSFNGIFAIYLADLSLVNNTVSGNGYSGVRLGDLSMGWFSGGSYSGNALVYQLFDIGCFSQTAIPGNLTGTSYGSSNCSYPTAPATTAPAK